MSIKVILELSFCMPVKRKDTIDGEGERDSIDTVHLLTIFFFHL